MIIEDLIQSNTDALVALASEIRWLSDVLAKDAPVEKPEPVISPVEPPKTVRPSVKKEVVLDYTTVRDLVRSLAMEYRDEIKELNKKHELPVFSDLLVDKNDISKGVVSQEKLEQYHSDLVKIAA